MKSGKAAVKLTEITLPANWALVQLRDIIKDFKRGPFGSAVKKSFFVPDGFKVYEQQNAIHDDAYRGRYFIDSKKFAELEKFQVGPGDFIVSCSGTIGRISRLPTNAKSGIINQALMRIRLDEELFDPRLFLLLFRSEAFQKLILVETRGSAMKNITGVQEFREVELKLPPIQEQKRIVEKIEELFSVLEAGVVSLRNIENQLKAYRRSVLKWAFEGKLTETWRSRCERAGSLARVQLLTGQKKKKNSAGATPNEGLPGTKVCGVTGWLQVRLIDVVETIFDGPFGSHLKTEDYCATGVRVIRLENIQHLNFDESKKTFISEHKYEGLKKHTVSGGDIIFSSFVNEEVRCCILPSLESAAIAKADCFCIRIGSNPINKQWLCYFLCSSDTYQQLSHQIHGFTRPRVNTSQIKVLSVPLCSEAEQVEIVREIEKRLAECDQLEALIQMELIRAEALRQSILKRAFSGRLVPQNTADGSASDLLARIANERLARVSKIVGDKTMRQKKSKSKKLIEV